LKNFTFKVIPVQPGQPNKVGPAPSVPTYSPPAAPQEPCPAPAPCPVAPVTPMPCPPLMPAPTPGPCPPTLPMPCPPQTPCPMPPMGAFPYPPCPGPSPYPQYPQYPVAPAYPSPPFRLAHAYVPWQFYNVVYCPTEALDKGTLFPELFQPQGIYGPCEGPQPCHTYFPKGGGSYGRA